MRERIEAVAAELMKGEVKIEPGKAKLLQTRRAVEQGWRAVSDVLRPGAAGVGDSRAPASRPNATATDGKGTPSGRPSEKDRCGAPAAGWSSGRSTPGANALRGSVAQKISGVASNERR